MTALPSPRAPLPQRDAELAALARHRDRVLAGEGCLAVVEVPAGIGKSSLLSASGRAAEASGMRVLRAWGGPLEQDAGWDIARQLFGPVLGGAEWDELAVGAALLLTGLPGHGRQKHRSEALIRSVRPLSSAPLRRWPTPR